MHISGRYDVFNDFQSDVIHVENKENNSFFVTHFHIVFRPYPLTPFDKHPKFCVKWKVLQSYIILEESSFGSNFRRVRVAIILNLFWVIFHGILPEVLSNLYKSFTSDATKLSPKKTNFWLKELFGLHSYEDI